MVCTGVTSLMTLKFSKNRVLRCTEESPCLKHQGLCCFSVCLTFTICARLELQKRPFSTITKYMKPNRAHLDRSCTLAVLVSSDLDGRDLDYIQATLTRMCLPFFSRKGKQLILPKIRSAGNLAVVSWCKANNVSYRLMPVSSGPGDQDPEDTAALNCLWSAQKVLFFWDYSRDHVMQGLESAWRMSSIVKMKVRIKENNKWRTQPTTRN